MSDDLFSPTVRERPVSGKRPWRPESIFYPGFFGGPLAAAVLGVLNGRRLRLPGSKLALIAAAGLVGLGGRLAISAFVDASSSLRLAGAVCGALVWLVIIGLQRRPFRAFTYADGEPASLVKPGIGAVIGLGLLEAVIIFGVIR
jgi:hypothetical protein